MIKCILCGKDAEIDVFCEDCWLKKQNLFEIKDIEVKVCKNCGSFLEKNKWKRYKNLESGLENIVKKNIKSKNRIVETDIFLRKIGNRFCANIKCRGYISPCRKEKIESRSIFIKIENSLCENCKKFLRMEYNFIIQIRTRKKINLENINFAKIEKVKNGYDIYFINKDDAEKMIKRLKQFKIKRSYKLIGEKQGKKIYKIFYSVKDYENRKKWNRRREGKNS